METIFERTYILNESVNENSIWKNDFAIHLKDMPQNIIRVCQYGFDEMVNNVIDHSNSKELKIILTLTEKALQFKIIDYGIGVFNKIKNDLKIDDPQETILELVKGKFTSDPENHSGEGIFFTSRLFDYFGIYSENLSFIGNNTDCFFEHLFTDIDGTLVVMEIMKNSTINTADVFNEYTDPDKQPNFFKTIIPVRLMQSEGVELMSRSQAKRLITRFERFAEVVLDFTGVDFIGQGFSDEIFRVFANAHPDTQLVPINCQREVQNMIDIAFNKYISRAANGTVTFDYSNNNGRYWIGYDTLSFELSFSKAGDSSIYMLNDPPGIDTVAIAKDISEIYRIKEAHIYDGSSRIRCPKVNQVVVLQNSNGFYAAVKIISIKDDTRDDAKNDEVVFDYVIQTNGSSDFTGLIGTKK